MLENVFCLPNKFNNSPDGIPKGLLNKYDMKYVLIFYKIFTRFLEEGFYPDIWKIS